MPKKKSHRRRKAQSRQKQVELVRKQVGLLVTKELQTAIDACKEEVGRIAQECRQRNVKFRDHDFDLSEDWKRCVYGLKYESYSCTAINSQRITEIYANPKFFNVNGAAESSAIIQGNLGDCYFLAALGTVCCIPGLIEKICVARDEEVGVYGFIFFQDDGWVRVIVDDFLATATPKSFDSLPADDKRLFCDDRQLFHDVQSKGSKHLVYAKSGSDGETWVPLIEKAYAKLYGNYHHIIGGKTFEAIEDLSGGVSTAFATKDILDRDRFWKEEFLQVNKDRLLSAAFFGTTDYQQGLVPSHAYSVLKAVEWNGKRFVVVRNPWGDTEWTGPWSDGSKEWTSEWVGALKELNHVFGNDGQFVMEYQDFLFHFQQIGRTFLFDDTWLLVSEWMKVDTPNIPEVATWGNLSYRLTVPEPTKAVITLSRLNTRSFDTMPLGPDITFQYAIVKHGESQPIRITPVSATTRLTLELNLEAGLYLVYVKVEHRWSLTDTDISHCDLNPGVETRTVTNIMAAKVRSLSLVKNWETGLKAKLIPKTLLDVIEEDIAAEAPNTNGTVLIGADAGNVVQSPTTNGDDQPGTWDVPLPVASEEKSVDIPKDAAIATTKEPSTPSLHIDIPVESKPMSADHVPSSKAPVLAFHQVLLLFLLRGFLLFFDLVARGCLVLIDRKEDTNVAPSPNVAVDSITPANSAYPQEPETPLDGLPAVLAADHTGHSSATAIEEHWHALYDDSESCVFLGLRVYTQTKEPCSIVGKVKVESPA